MLVDIKICLNLYIMKSGKNVDVNLMILVRKEDVMYIVREIIGFFIIIW